MVESSTDSKSKIHSLVLSPRRPNYETLNVGDVDVVELRDVTWKRQLLKDSEREKFPTRTLTEQADELKERFSSVPTEKCRCVSFSCSFFERAVWTSETFRSSECEQDTILPVFHVTGNFCFNKKDEFRYLKGNNAWGRTGF